MPIQAMRIAGICGYGRAFFRIAEMLLIVFLPDPMIAQANYSRFGLELAMG